jgi:hypothetical protein
VKKEKAIAKAERRLLWEEFLLGFFLWKPQRTLTEFENRRIELIAKYRGETQ